MRAFLFDLDGTREDMHAARHHGVTAMGALWGYGSREELEAQGAQHLCAVPRDLPAALARLHAPT
jgi:phosphoglycolate phosphatase